MRYRRAWHVGGTWFFTVNLRNRNETLLVDNADLLRATFRSVQRRHPFTIDAIVVLPDHLHAILTLPPQDTDFAMRWNQIKGRFSKLLPVTETISAVQQHRRERGIWQHRYWEHLIRDERDLENHVNYIHFNPVKHGHVARASDWPHSSIRRFIERGMVSEDWAADVPAGSGGYGERS